MRRVLVVTVAALFLFGCGQGTIRTITLSPMQTNGSYQSWYSNNIFCYIPVPGQGFWTNGLGPETVGPGELYSGFEDVYNHGADPFACIEQQQALYRGQVSFDLSAFDSIVGAILTFDIENSIVENGGVNPRYPPVSVATTLGMSTGTIDSGNGPYFWNYDGDVPIPSCGPLIKPNCSIGVSTQVRAWVAKEHDNFGFILAGPILDFPEQLPQDNNGSVTWYNDFQLQVTYDTAQNPRAPH